MTVPAFDAATRTFIAGSTSTFADKRDFLASRQLVKVFCASNSVILMGGLNTGQFARVMLLACPRMMLHGFEILPDQYRISSEALRGWNATVHHAGLSASSGSLYVSNPPNGASEMARLEAGGEHARASVPTVALADFAREQRLTSVEYVALDTEGHEQSVLEGLRLNTASGRRTFPVIQYEVGGLWTGEYDLRRQNASELAGLWASTAAELVDSGYELYVIGAHTHNCRVTIRDQYACTGDAVYLRVPSPEFFAALAPQYSLLRDSAVRQRLTFGPSWNVLAINPTYARSKVVRFVRSHQSIVGQSATAAGPRRPLARVRQSASFDALLEPRSVCCPLGVTFVTFFPDKVQDELRHSMRTWASVEHEHVPAQSATSTAWPALFVELVLATHTLRTHLSTHAGQQPSLPLALITNPAAASLLQSHKQFLSLWEHVLEFDVQAARAALTLMGPGARKSFDSWDTYLWKIVCMLSSPFDRTLYLDTDVFVLSKTFPMDLLQNTLHVSDLAFVVDISRGGQKIRHSGVGPYSLNPPQFAHGLPNLCSCVIAYRRTNSTLNLWRRVALRMANAYATGQYNVHPQSGRSALHLSDITDERTKVRPGDQEFLWLELSSGPSDPQLRLMVLPEEYYCPTLPGKVMKRSPVHTVHSTNAKLPCHTVHGHLSAGGGAELLERIQTKPGGPQVDVDGWLVNVTAH